MKKKMSYIGLVIALTVFALVGALITPATVEAQNPYVVGGELETPPVPAGENTLLVGLVAALAVALGAIVAIKLK